MGDNNSMSGLVKFKRETFRFEIRRQQIEQTFTEKRQRFINSQCHDMEHYNLEQIIKVFQGSHYTLGIDTIDKALHRLLFIFHQEITLLKKGQNNKLQEMFQILRDCGLLSQIIEFVDMELPVSIIKKAIWLLTNIAFAEGVCSTIVFDTSVPDRIIQILVQGCEELQIDALELVDNLIIDKDSEIFEYFLDREEFLRALSNLSRSVQFSEEIAHTCFYLLNQILTFKEDILELQCLPTIISCVSETIHQQESMYSVLRLLNESEKRGILLGVVTYIFENHFGLIGKFFYELETLVVKEDEDQLPKLKISLQIVEKISTIQDGLIEYVLRIFINQKLISMRLSQIISKLFVSITNVRVLELCCQIITNLLQNDDFASEVSPFLIQEVFKQSTQRESYPLHESASITLSRLVFSMNDETINFMIKLGLVEQLVDGLQVAPIECLHALKQLLDTKPITHQLNMLQGNLKLEELTQNSNHEVAAIASSIMTTYYELQVFL